MATIGGVLRKTKINELEALTFQIACEVGREFDRVSTPDDLRLGIDYLRLRFEVDFFRFDMHEMEQKALVAIFCCTYCIVSEDNEYLLEPYSSSRDLSQIDLDDEESYKLNVNFLEDPFNNYDEDFQFIYDSLKISRPWWIVPSSIKYESLLGWQKKY